jgi:hypothetical protein
VFSYTLVLALLLLLPGLCAWAGLRAARRNELLAPRPDRPNSTLTLLVIVGGSLAGHFVAAAAYALQAAACAHNARCLSLSFDPNVYRLIVEGTVRDGPVTDAALFTWLLELLLTGLFTGVATRLVAALPPVAGELNAAESKWLNASLEAVRRRKAILVAYVVSKTEFNGVSLAYEGVIQQLSMDDDQVIVMLVLTNVDRFLVRITEDGLQRTDDAGLAPIAQMQFHLAEIANVALEVVEWPTAPIAALAPPAPAR